MTSVTLFRLRTSIRLTWKRFHANMDIPYRRFSMKNLILILITFLAFTACQQPKTDSTQVQVRADVYPDLDTRINLGSLYFNSRDLACKSPFGAVTIGQSVTLHIYTGKGDVRKVNAVLTRQDMVGNSTMEKYQKYKTLPMSITGQTNGQDIWEVTFSIDKLGVYGYHFELFKTDEDAIVLADNQNQVKVPYVNIKGTGGEGRITPLKKYKLPYTLTVYQPDDKLAPWTANMIIYYIFPDRFKNGNKKNDPIPGKTLFYDQKTVEFHANWNDPKPWVPGKSDGNETDDKEYCNDFYGGDLEGVIQKLDYLKTLGVNVIYLNPIFFAPSNHKYDTADYKKIDPAFGDLAVFKKLVAEAKKRDIHIILDTSLNHSGSDSVYMDRYGKYPGLGAFEKEVIHTDSPYYDWYEFNPKATNPDQMYNQWANPTLANLKESDSYKKFAYKDSDSVTRYWLTQGAGGWRMDVTPWVSDDFWREWRNAIRIDNPEALTVSEVWFDASKYLVGDMFDTTMNYIFRQCVLDMARGKSAETAMQGLEMIRENYPAPAFKRAMNLLSSHDLPRVLWEVGYKEYGQTDYAEFRARMLLAVSFQFTYPGAPTIYYGDEIGLTGGNDPFNRGPYPWKEDGGNYGDPSLLADFQKLAALRRSHPVFQEGELKLLYTDKNLVIIQRQDKQEKIVLVFNNSKQEKGLPAGIIPMNEYRDLFRDSTLSISDTTMIPALSFFILK